MKIFNYSRRQRQNVLYTIIYNVDTYTYLFSSDDHNIQHDMGSQMDNKLETSQTFIKKKRFLIRRNGDKNPCALKISKTVTEKKRKKYGPKLNLPCCIGSKNPCNRQKNQNLSQRN